MAVNVRQLLVSGSKYNIKCPYQMAADSITVHNTANDATAENEVKYMIGNNNQVSFHVAVDDKEAVQGIPFDRNAWHAGDGNGRGNRNSIAVEICYSKSGGDRFVKAERNAAELIAGMLKERGWGIDKVKKHQDWSGKYCPHRTLDMGWQRFLDMVASFMNGAEPPAYTEEPSKPAPQNGSEKIDVEYAVMIEGGRTLPFVKNMEDYAGLPGKKIVGIAMRVNNGASIKYRITTVNGKTYPFVTGCNWNDGNNGYAGDGRNAIAKVECYLYSPNSDKYIFYKVAPVGRGYYPPQRDMDKGNGMDGYAGVSGTAIDKFQAWIE